MKVLVAGGSGFIGRKLTEELHSRGHSVTVLSRTPDSGTLLSGVRSMTGDVTDYESIEEAFVNQDAVVNLVALSPLFTPSDGSTMHDRVHRGGTENVVQAMEAHDVRKLVQMSALGADPEGPTAYIRAKGSAERVVRDSGLNWVIIRPSVVFGDGGEFVEFTKTLTTPYVTGLPSGGKTRFQPIWVGDLVPMLADAIEDDDHVGQVYELGGSEVLTLADVARRIYRSEGKSLVVLPIPMSVARVGLTLADVIPGFPMGLEQYRSLRFDNTVKENDVTAFGRDPHELQTLGDYLATTTTETKTAAGGMGRTFVGGDVWVAFVVILGLVALALTVTWQGLQIPGYLVMVGFDLLQNPFAPGLGGLAFWIGFLLYCYGLAVLAGVVSRWLRVRVLGNRTRGTWRYPLAGVLVLLGVLAIGVGLLPLIYPAAYTMTSCSSATGCIVRTGHNSTPNAFSVGVGFVFLGLSLVIALRDVYRGRPRKTA